MNVIQYTIGNMGIDDATTIFGAILEQSNIEFTVFNVDDIESVEIIDNFYSNMKTLNTDIGLLVKIDSQCKELSVSSRERLKEVLKKIEDRGVNVFIIKSDSVLLTLSFMADYIMYISPSSDEDNAYILNIIKHMDISAFKEEAMVIRFDENGYIYFHEMFLDTMNDIQRCILKQNVGVYYSDNDSGNFYLTTPDDIDFDIDGINLDEIIEEIAKELNQEFTDEYRDDIKSKLIGKDNHYDTTHVGNPKDLFGSSAIHEDPLNIEDFKSRYTYDWLNSKDRYVNNSKIRKPAPQPKKLRILIDGEEV